VPIGNDKEEEESNGGPIGDENDNHKVDTSIANQGTMGVSKRSGEEVTHTGGEDHLTCGEEVTHTGGEDHLTLVTIAQEIRERSAAKADNAEVPEYLWLEHMFEDGIWDWDSTSKEKIKSLLTWF
jgi:hypothetical protein